MGNRYTMQAESLISEFEEFVASGSTTKSLTFRVMEAVRWQLRRCSMNASYADIFAARANISILLSEVSDVQINRLLCAAEKMTLDFYVLHNNAGYNDQAISEMAPDFNIIMGD